MLHGECKECGRNFFLTNDYECGKCSTKKTDPKGRSDTNRLLYFLTADALKNVKYRAIFLLPIAFIVVVCMINLGLNGILGIAKLPYLVELYIVSSILLLMAVVRLMYVDSR